MSSSASTSVESSSVSSSSEVEESDIGSVQDVELDKVSTRKTKKSGKGKSASSRKGARAAGADSGTSASKSIGSKSRGSKKGHIAERSTTEATQVEVESSSDKFMTTNRVHAVFLLVTQLVFVVLFLVLGRYGEGANGDRNALDFRSKFGIFQDVNVMIFVGFGFLMVFLRRYTFSSVALSFLTAALSIQMYIFFWSLWHGLFEKWHWVVVNLDVLLRGDFAAGSVLITFGFLLGTVSPLQICVLALLEVPLFALNEEIGLKLKAADAGGSMTIHMFGAYFGAAVSLMLHFRRKIARESRVHHKDNAPSRWSDTLAMVGTLFLWMFWPSFNSAIAGPHGQERAAVNTAISLLGSCVMAFAASSLLRGKLHMPDIQNATLAGGVAIGAAADMMVSPGGAFAVGNIAGFLSTFGFVRVSPFLERFGLHDTCGAHNLHGMPALLGGLVSVIVAATTATSESFDNPQAFAEVFPAVAPEDSRSSGAQALVQLAYIGTTLGIALTGGCIAGLIISFLGHDHGMFRDDGHFEVEDEEEGGEKEA